MSAAFPCPRQADQCPKSQMTCETSRLVEVHTYHGTVSEDQVGIDSEVVEIEVDPCSVGRASEIHGTTALKNLGLLAEASCTRPEIVTSETAQTYQYVEISQERDSERKIGFLFENFLPRKGCLSTKKQRALLVDVPYSGDIHTADWDNHHIAADPYVGFGLESVLVDRAETVH